MKDITTKICEDKFKINEEYDKIYALIKSLKDWYNYGVEHTRKNDEMNSHYIKSLPVYNINADHELNVKKLNIIKAWKN